MKLSEKITKGEWNSEGINIKAIGTIGRIGQSFIKHVPCYENKFAEDQESIANAKCWAASKEMLSILESLVDIDATNTDETLKLQAIAELFIEKLNS